MDKIEIGKKLFDQTMGVLNHSLDVRTVRHRVLSSNVANVETPNYTSKDLPFQKILERSVKNYSTIPLQKTHPQHFPESGSSLLTTDWSSEVENQPLEEGVNIDQEMAKLAENNLMFQAGIQSLVKKLEALKMTIAEGR